MNKILIVDDEESIRWVLKKGLEKKGYEVHTAKNSDEALSKIENQNFFLAFFDIIMGQENGLSLLETAKKFDTNLMVIIMTAQDTATNAIGAMQKGAYDYISKPFDFDEIYLIVEKVLELQSLRGKICALESELKGRFEAGDIVGRSKKMRHVYKLIGKAADSDLPILITGESGTGKELVAKAVHKNSLRKNEPFIALNCAAIPKELMESEMFGHEKGSFTGAYGTKIGKFELAHKGTLFFDEIGDMDKDLQAKILRAIQEKEFSRVGGKNSIPFDIRIISATNRNLENAIKKKEFRLDLYHRLNVINISIPPLREREEDIPALTNYFLEQMQKKKKGQTQSVTPEVLTLFKQYQWKGNVRELENVIKRAVVLSAGHTITVDLLPEQMNKNSKESEQPPSISDTAVNNLKKTLEHIMCTDKTIKNKGNLYTHIIKIVEKTLIEKILEETEYNQVKSAQILGINRNTLSRKIKELQISIAKKHSTTSTL